MAAPRSRGRAASRPLSQIVTHVVKATRNLSMGRGCSTIKQAIEWYFFLESPHRKMKSDTGIPCLHARALYHSVPTRFDVFRAVSHFQNANPTVTNTGLVDLSLVRHASSSS